MKIATAAVPSKDPSETLSDQMDRLTSIAAGYSARRYSNRRPIPCFTPQHTVPQRILSLSAKQAAKIRGGSLTYEAPARTPTQKTATPPNIPATSIPQPPRIERSPNFRPNFRQPSLPADWSDSVQSVLDQPPARLTQYLISAGLLFSGIFVAWACIGQIQEVSHAQGQLAPQGETYKIQPVISGKVDSLAIRESELVSKGQVLLSLDSDLLEDEVRRLEQAIVAAEQELSQVRSLVDKTEQESIARAQIAVANTQSTLATLQQAEESIVTNRTMLLSLNSDMEAHQERFNRLQELEVQGAISKEYLFSVEQAVRDKQRAILQNEGEKEQMLAQINKAEAELSQKQAEEAQMKLVSQQSLQELRIQEQQLQANIADFHTQLSQAKTNLSHSHIQASTNGIISALAVSNIGEFVQPGQVLAEITPSDVPLVLSAVVPHQEAGLLEVGMETNVKMDAFPYQDYGTLSGKVISISPDAKAFGEGISGYQVNISLDEDFVTHEGRTVKLQIGQTASAEIVVRRRRIIEILLDPIRQITENELSL